MKFKIVRVSLKYNMSDLPRYNEPQYVILNRLNIMNQ